MKKVVKKILIVIIFIMLLQIVLYLFKDKHEINYKIKNDYKYEINEIYNKDNYIYKIKVNKQEFIFSVDNIFYKSKRNINKIYYYEKNNISCIYPVYKNSNVYCKKDNEYVSYYLVKDDIKEFIKKLKKLNYKNNSWNETKTKISKIKDITFYNNIDDNTYIYIWKYDGFYSVNNKKQEELNIFNNDNYFNKLGVLVDKYYILPNYDEKYDFNKIYIYNIINNKEKTIKLKNKISFNSYINGIKNNKLYLFDTDNLKQYEINPKNKKYQIVGDINKKGIYYENNKLIYENIYEFKNSILFKETYKIKDYDLIKKDNNNTYYTLDNKLYKYDDISKQTTIMYNNKISNLYVINNEIYFTCKDSLYLLKDNLYKILTYKELEFNPTNKIAIYKKK